MYPTIKQGSTGDIVKVWQKILGPPVVADGDFGPITKTSTAEWQTKHGLPPTGIVDNATWEKSTSSSAERTQDEPRETNLVDTLIKGVFAFTAAIGGVVGTKFLLRKARKLF
jgi:peptidoglycan hydrolase-like protein with peptidoglycan-binding domain